jgi:uncharacterized protein HemX
MAILGFLTGNLWRTVALAILVALGVSGAKVWYYRTELTSLKAEVALATQEAKDQANAQLRAQQAAHDAALAAEQSRAEKLANEFETLKKQLETTDDYDQKLAAALRLYLNGMLDADRRFAADLPAAAR